MSRANEPATVASGYVLDSSIIIEAERRRLDLAVHTAGRRETCALSVITVGELLHGVHRASDAARRVARSAFVEAVLAQFPIYDIDVTIARTYAATWAELAEKGTVIGANDLWIAATALAKGHAVVTANLREFERVPNLVVEQWS